MKRSMLLVVLVLASLAGTGGPAYAKGPGEASIHGGGQVVRLVIDDSGRLQDLADVTGFWQVGEDVRSVRRPATLGPGYEVRYVVGTDNRNRPLVFRQVLYPSSSAGSLVYTPPGQTLYGVAARSRWAESPVNLALFLRGYGIRVPAKQPSPTAAPAAPAVVPTVVPTAAATAGEESGMLQLGVPAIALALLLAGAVLVRRRRRA